MKAQEKRIIEIEMTTEECETFKSARNMLLEIYWTMSDGKIELRAKDAADFMSEMLWNVAINDEKEA